ncbi:MAG: MFS transporter [Prevotellaceae bacterium]|nr:MFS transporter [Prevotellaceae bacterium]
MSTTKKAQLTDRKYRVPFVLITGLFFLWGFARAILDVLNKHFQNALAISITRSAWIQITTYLGYFLMAIPAGFFINRFGYRRGVVCGLLLFATGALLIIPGSMTGSFTAFLGCLFIIGVGLVFLETSANPYVTQLGPTETATSRLNFSQSFNGLGGIFATLTIGQFLFSNNDKGGNVAIPYAILGVIVLVIAFIFSRVELPEIQYKTTAEDRMSGTKIMKLLKHHPAFVFGLLALLAYEVAEISINTYFINFVTGMHWMTDRTASLVLSCALAFFMIGRFLGSWVMSRHRPEEVLFGCATGSVCCIGIVLCNIGELSLIGLLGNYFFEAIMFPTIFSLSLRGLGNLTKSASSLLMMTPIGGCGFLLMGLLADRTHLVLPFLIPFTALLVVFSYAYFVRRSWQKEKRANGI